MDRRVKANKADAAAIIEDLHQHHVLEKLTQVIPKLSMDVLFKFSKAPAFQDLLITASPSTNTPPIFTTQGDAFSTLLSALPHTKTRNLFLAITPELVAQALSAHCGTEHEALDLAISLELGNAHKDAIIAALASASFHGGTVTLPPKATVNLPPVATGGNVINAGPAPLETPTAPPSTRPAEVPASTQSSGTAGNAETCPQPSVSATNPTHALLPVTAAAPPTITDSANPAATALSTDRTGANVSFPSLWAVTQVNKNAIQSKPGPAVNPSQAMPVATALKARLLGKSGRSRTAVNLQDPKDAPPLGKGKSSKPHKGAPQPSGDDGDEESSAKSSSSESEQGDYSESDPTDDDTPLSAPRGGSKAQKGKAAVAAPAVTTTDEDEVEPESPCG